MNLRTLNIFFLGKLRVLLFMSSYTLSYKHISPYQMTSIYEFDTIVFFYYILHFVILQIANYTHFWPVFDNHLSSFFDQLIKYYTKHLVLILEIDFNVLTHWIIRWLSSTSKKVNQYCWLVESVLLAFWNVLWFISSL